MFCKSIKINYYLIISLLLCLYSVAYASFDNKELDVYIVNPVSSAKILSNTFPLPGIKNSAINISAAIGEKTSASFVIRSLNDKIINLLPITSDLKSHNSVLSSDVLDIKVVKCWFQGGTAWEDIRASSKSIMTPELLLKDDSLIKINESEGLNYIKIDSQSNNIFYKLISEKKNIGLRSVIASVKEFSIKDSKELMPITIDKNNNKQYWITFRIPNDANPGMYNGEISLVANGRQIETIAINLEIYPFSLDVSKLEYGLYYRGVLVEGDGSISSEHKNEEQLKAELLNMIEHGVDNPVVYQPFTNYNLLKKVLKIRKEVGLINKPLYYLGIRTENPNNKIAIARYKKEAIELNKIAKEYAINKCYIYGIDEAESEMLLRQRFVWSEIQKTGVGIFAAGWKTGSFELIGDAIDVFIDGQTPSRTISHQFHSLGKKIFSYNRPQAGVENPFVYRKNYGLRLWQLNYDGVINYAYQDGFGDIWNDFDHAKFRDHCFTYPTVNGVIDTIAWEGFREGINDVKYISTLENKINDCSTDLKYESRVKDAVTYLNKIRDYAGDDLDGVRKGVAHHILKLQ